MTHQPVQAYTFAALAKSFGEAVATTGTMEPLRKEALDGKMSEVLYGACKDGLTHMLPNGRFRKGYKSALAHLTLCKGYELRESTEALKTLHKSNILGR